MRNGRTRLSEASVPSKFLTKVEKTDYLAVIQGPGDNSQKIIKVFKGKSQLDTAKKYRDDWNTKNADKIKKNKKGAPISSHMARLMRVPADAQLNKKPYVPEVGKKVMWSFFSDLILKGS